MAAQSNHRDKSYPPRGMRRETAAWYVGVGRTKFDEWVDRDLMPPGKLVDGVRLWDRFLLDEFFNNLPDEESSPSIAPQSSNAQSSQWSKMVR